MKIAKMMTNNQKVTPPSVLDKSRKSGGFTIIEVALVLAIAGLIFLVVFLALPALQNSQKDTALKQDVGRIASALQSIKADNQGVLDPTTDASGAAILKYTGKLSQVTTIRSGSGATGWSSGYFPKTTNHGYVEVNLTPGYRCPSPMPAANTTSSPTFNGTADSSASATITAWLWDGSDYCVSI